MGYTLDEITNEITGATPASFEPTIDYVVTKIPRFAFEKFKGAKAELATAMKSVGEVMAIGRNFQESMQKALRGLETDLDGFNRVVELEGVHRDVIIAALSKRTPDRLLQVAQAFREGLTVADIAPVTGYDAWFLRQIEEIVAAEKQISTDGLPQRCRRPAPPESDGLFRQAPRHAGRARGRCARAAWAKRRPSGPVCCTMPCARWRARPARPRCATCAASWAWSRSSSASTAAPPSSRPITPYMYSTYEAPSFGAAGMRGRCHPTGARS